MWANEGTLSSFVWSGSNLRVYKEKVQNLIWASFAVYLHLYC